MATTIRKTAKYYREELTKSHNISTLENLIKEVCTKFGGKDKSISLWNRVEFNWNHRVEGFSLGKSGRVLVKVYWQGDSTDGDDYVYLTDVLRNGTEVIPAEHEWLGDRTYCRHSDIRVKREEVDDLVEELAKWLSPKEIKERKIAKQRSQFRISLNPKMNEFYKRGSHGWMRRDESNDNGCNAVRELLDKELDKLMKLPMEEVHNIMESVFRQNCKSDTFFKKNWNGDREVPYDLAH